MLSLLFFLIIASVNLVNGETFDIYPENSIQETVNSASNGDTLLIHDGDYYETVVLYGKTLTISSLYLVDADTSHIAQTIVHADPSRQDTNSCFVYSYGELLSGKLVGLTLTGGTGTRYVFHDVDEFGGGAVYLRLSGVSVQNCVIQNSSSVYGGGIGLFKSDFHFTQTFCEIRNCKIQNCYSELYGGGVFAENCSLWAKSIEIDSNTSAYFEGGLSVLNSYMEMDSCRISHCLGGFGGMTFSGRGHITSCLFEQNSTYQDYAFGTDLTVYDSFNILVSHNIFQNNGGQCYSIYLDGYRNNNQSIHFIGNVIANHSSSITTGTLLVNDALGGDIAYNIIRNNTNSHGGAVYVLGESDIRIHHNVFDHNITLDDTLGSAIRVIPYGHPTIDSNIFIGNNFPSVTCETGIHNVNAHAENNWWGDASGPYHATLNPNGQGDSLISDSVYFIPWLTSPPDTSMPNAIDERERPEILSTWQLSEVFPNPFNSTVRLVIAGFTGREFRVTLHNLLGQEIAEIAHGPITGGQIVYNAPANLASGVYFVRASDKQFVQSKKIVLIK